MLFAFLPLVFSAVQAQNSTSPSATQIAVYPPFPIRNGTNMQHTQRAYDVSLITAISTSTLVYAISCSPWTTMTRFNDVCGTSYVPNVITVTESPEEWHWSAQGKSLECTNLREKTKTCTSVTNNYSSDIAPGTQDVGDFLPGFLNYFTTMTPVAVNLTAGFKNVPTTVLASIENDATGLVTVQTDTPSSSGSEAQSATSAGGSAASSDTAKSSRTTDVIAPVLTAPTGAAPRVTGAMGRD